MSNERASSYEWEGYLCRRHPHRLEPEKYRVPGQPVLMTVCAENKRPVLTADAVRDEMIGALSVAANIAGCEMMAWCLMPDHVHALLRVGREGGDLLRFLHSYKSWTGRVMTEAGFSGTWERSFWDRHARSRDDISALVSYVLHNPVRAGLCGRWDEWAHSEFCMQIRGGPKAGRHGS